MLALLICVIIITLVCVRYYHLFRAAHATLNLISDITQREIDCVRDYDKDDLDSIHAAIDRCRIAHTNLHARYDLFHSINLFFALFLVWKPAASFFDGYDWVKAEKIRNGIPPRR